MCDVEQLWYLERGDPFQPHLGPKQKTNLEANKVDKQATLQLDKLLARIPR